MIFLTGHGAIANEFKSAFKCEIVSLRNMTVEKIDRMILGSTAIIHNAANLYPTTLAEALRDNFELTKKLVDRILAVKADTPFIYISSMSFLATENQAMPEDSMSLYARSKYLGEQYVLSQNLQNFKVTRFSTIFYANALKDGLSKLIWDAATKQEISLINHGVSLRDFIPIQIGVRYLFSIAKYEGNQPIFNIASGTKTSFYDIANILKESLPNLIVNNAIQAAGDPILSSFSTDSLEAIGVIHFELKGYVNDYLKSCLQ